MAAHRLERPGFDAFVTNVNLGRTRVSVKLPEHSETRVNGSISPSRGTKPAASASTSTASSWRQEATGLFDTGLDQFGPHSRVIGPTGVESSYSYDRGGDIDKLRIYDRMLSDENIAGLAKNGSRNPAVDRKVAAGSSPSEAARRSCPPGPI